MRRLLSILVGVFVVVGVAPSVQAAPPGETQRVIVQVTSPRDVHALAAEAERLGGSIRHVYSRVLDGFAADLPPQAIEALQRNPLVEAVTPDAPTSATETQSDPPWGLDRIDQRAGLNGAYGYDTTGAGVTVYVVDSGIRFSHSEYRGRVRSGYDFVDLDSDASDCGGHGTHVAGTVGGQTYGVAKGVSMVSLRVWDCGNSG